MLCAIRVSSPAFFLGHQPFRSPKQHFDTIPNVLRVRSGVVLKLAELVIDGLCERIVRRREFGKEQLEAALKSTEGFPKFNRSDLLTYVRTVVGHDFPDPVVEIELRKDRPGGDAPLRARRRRLQRFHDGRGREVS
jgi:hypothetical protein